MAKTKTKTKKPVTQEGTVVGVTRIGKDRDPMYRECYSPIGYKRLTPKCKIQAGIYYMGQHEGCAFLWVEHGNTTGIKRQFKGDALFKVNSKVGLFVEYRAAKSTGVTILGSEWVSL